MDAAGSGNSRFLKCPGRQNSVNQRISGRFKMGKNKNKTRQKMDPRKSDIGESSKPKREKDWDFDDIARSKTRRR